MCGSTVGGVVRSISTFRAPSVPRLRIHPQSRPASVPSAPPPCPQTTVLPRKVAVGFLPDGIEKNMMNVYHPEKCAVFCKTKERFGGLSNMAAGFPLLVCGVECRTSEALYQALRFPHLPQIQAEILAQKSPMSAKMKAKPHNRLSRPDWHEVREEIMDFCLHLKLEQHWECFGDVLLSTGELAIVERSKRDTYWGAKSRPDGLLEGENRLGLLLVGLREKRRMFESKSSLQRPPLEGIVLLGRAFDKEGKKGGGE